MKKYSLLQKEQTGQNVNRVLQNKKLKYLNGELNASVWSKGLVITGIGVGRVKKL